MRKKKDYLKAVEVIEAFIDKADTTEAQKDTLHDKASLLRQLIDKTCEN